MNPKYYTYAHIRNDTNQIFYIGKGIGKRAWWKHGRNNYWHKIVNKHGYTVEILAYWKTEADAFNHEKLLISCFKDMQYELVNFTDGGDGVSGLKHSEETKRKLSESAKRFWLDKDRSKKIREIRKNQWSKEARENASKRSEIVWSNEDARKKHSEILKVAYSSEEKRKMQADRNRKFRESEEGRKAMSERSKNYWASKESQTDEAKKIRSEATKRSWITRKGLKND